MKRRTSLILSLNFVAGLIAPVSARTAIIYVNKDNACPGTGEDHSPYCSIQNAFDKVAPGDRIRIRAASTPYDESDTASISGAFANPIILEADDPTNPPVISGSSASINLNRVSYWTIQNLVFDGSGVSVPAFALRIGGDGWTVGATSDVVGVQVLNNTFRNWGASNRSPLSDGYYDFDALVIQGGWAPPSTGSFTISGTVVKGNIFDGDRQVALEVMAAKDSVIQNNEFKNLVCGTVNGGNGEVAVVTNGVHAISGRPQWNARDVYKNNSFHDFVTSCPFKQGRVSYTEQAAVHADVDESSSIFDSNLVYNLNLNQSGVSQSIFIEDGCYGWTVKNNIIHDVTGPGIFSNPSGGAPVSTANEYFNNTLYNVGTAGHSGIVIESGNAAVENNIVAMVNSNSGSGADIELGSSAGEHGATMTIDYNDYLNLTRPDRIGRSKAGTYYSFPLWKSFCRCDSHSLSVDPQFVSTSAFDFHPRSTSPVISKGVTLSSVHIDYDGAVRLRGAYDIGAHELAAANRLQK